MSYDKEPAIDQYSRDDFGVYRHPRCESGRSAHYVQSHRAYLREPWNGTGWPRLTYDFDREGARFHCRDCARKAAAGLPSYMISEVFPV